MTVRLARPWDSAGLPEHHPFGPAHCLLSEYTQDPPRGVEHTLLMAGATNGRNPRLVLHPYPRRQNAAQPAREGFLERPLLGHEAHNDSERRAEAALARMNQVLARVEELEQALDDPADVWPRLRAAWDRAGDECDPRMAEIIRQAREIQPRLRGLAQRLRRVLRRDREQIPISRAEEIDRASMRWLVRQPGRTIPERAGADQRILATVRLENFDTLENRVLHAYAQLAAAISREWMQEHRPASGSVRYKSVSDYRKLCRRIANELAAMGVRRAGAGITPNYVLMENLDYRSVYQGWLRLLTRLKTTDNLWAWQAETWTDFAVLSVVLAFDELDEIRLIAQSPIRFRPEADSGRMFDQDQPMSIFWMRRTGLIIEVHSRFKRPGKLLTLARAHISLRITDSSRGGLPRRIAVWTPHAMERIDLRAAAEGALSRLRKLQQTNASNEILQAGLILTPGHGEHGSETAASGGARVDAIALDGAGDSLTAGLRYLRNFIRDSISGSSE